MRTKAFGESLGTAKHIRNTEDHSESGLRYMVLAFSSNFSIFHAIKDVRDSPLVFPECKLPAVGNVRCIHHDSRIATIARTGRLEILRIEWRNFTEGESRVLTAMAVGLQPQCSQIVPS